MAQTNWNLYAFYLLSLFWPFCVVFWDVTDITRNSIFAVLFVANGYCALRRERENGKILNR